MLIELLTEYGLFFAKAATFVVAAFLIVGAVAAASQRPGHDKGGELHVKKLNDQYEDMEIAIRSAVMDAASLKAYDKSKRSDEKQKAKDQKKAAKLKHAKEKQAKKKQSTATDEPVEEKTVYVLDFDGDMKASEVDGFREEITAVLTIAKAHDEVVLKLESPGGMVHAYGLAASQLARFKSAGVPLTICVDKVAASGGYMMACIADKILAAPFAVIGSIGVVASIPNFNKILKKNDVDYELLTAGEHKRTLTMLGENTDEGRKKFVSDLEETHTLFKDFVTDYRPQLDIAAVATGETWYGQQALAKLLIDDISTSDEYITSLAKTSPVYEVSYVEKKHWQEKLGMSAQAALTGSFEKVFSSVSNVWNTRH